MKQSGILVLFKYLFYISELEMVLLKNKKIILGFFVLCSMGYFGAISNLEVNSFLRGELILIPLQALAVIYVTFWRRNLSGQDASSTRGSTKV